MKPPPHTRTYYLTRWKPTELYTLNQFPGDENQGAENIPVMGHHAARAMQRELNDRIRAERNLPPHPGFKRGERPPGRKPKLADPTEPVTIRLRKSVLDRLPGDVYERNAAIVAAVEKSLG